MKIIYAEEFFRQFHRLQKDTQQLFRIQESRFKENWRDSRLHIKKLNDHPFPFSFRVTRQYRVLFSFVDTDTALFGTIGNRRDIYRK